jgi:hypothetical protein
MKLTINLSKEFRPRLSQDNTVAPQECWIADIASFPLVISPVGVGQTKEEAVADLFFRLMPYQDAAVFDKISGVNVVENISEKANHSVLPQFVVPDYVVECIEELELGDLSDYAAMAVSQILTKTVNENYRGIFTNTPKIVDFWSQKREKVCVNFSDLPLNGENFRSNLLNRCQRVGQAILDAQVKPKTIDPDEGLPSWEEIKQVITHLTYSKEVDAVYGKFGEIFGCKASRCFTGTNNEIERGVFSSYEKACFFVDDSDEEISFDVEFPCQLEGGCNIAEIVFERIRLVRKARAKAIQEARAGKSL